MAGSSNFVQFDKNAANIKTDAAYAGSTEQLNGFVTGIASSSTTNKALYQVSTFVAAFAQVLANQGYTVSDSNITSLQTVLSNLCTNQGDVLITNATFTLGRDPITALEAATKNYVDTHTGYVYTLPVASATTLGGVKQGSGITIASDGTIAAPYSYTLPVATTAVLGGVKAGGANITISAAGVIADTYNYILPAATTTTLGGVKQGAGVTIAADGTLASPYTYTLPVATASIIGGVKTGAGITIATDGTIAAPYSYTLPVASTSVLGGVKQGTGITIDATGLLSATSGGLAPIGGIIIWSGAIASMPANWGLCDGTNGTPDLRDRFILGAGLSYAVAATGGEATHVLSVNELAYHTHLFPGDDQIGPAFGLNEVSVVGNWDWTSGSSATGNGWYDPGGNGAAGANYPHNNMPPYYALALIMRLT